MRNCALRLPPRQVGRERKREEDDRRILDLLSANKIRVGLGYKGETGWEYVDGVKSSPTFSFVGTGINGRKICEGISHVSCMDVETD